MFPFELTASSGGCDGEVVQQVHRVSTGFVVLCMLLSSMSCSSESRGTPSVSTVSIRVDVAIVATQVKATEVVYVAPPSTNIRTVGRVIKVSKAPGGLSRLTLRIDKDQRLPQAVSAYVCTNRVKLVAQRTSPPYLIAGSEIPASRSVFERRRC
jgi:hypothetical protein